jgi:hypothetical protein
MVKPLIFTPFTTKELKPTGWLKNQLEIQARGLSGNLDKIWPDIRDSKWIGGDKDGWERVPYWLDGFIPLAFLLDNDDMKKRAKKYIDAILKNQQDDGWIAPCTNEERCRYDVWAYFLICKVLALYADCSGDKSIEPAVYKALKRLNYQLESVTLFDWGAARWFECLIPLAWLYESRPEEWMLDLAQQLQVEGIDYEKLFNDWHYSQSRGKGRWSFLNHAVNIAMALKGSALMSRFNDEDPNNFADKAIKILERDHGMASGHFTGDECLSGNSPIKGAECCSVAEAMYSYEWLTSITGNSFWIDKLEQTAFNAFPATVSPDMWTHQYDQMTNQVQCSVVPNDKIPFETNSGESHLFGLEPNFGCCTANFNQAWPKFAMNVFMKTEHGISVSALAPEKLRTKIDGIDVAAEIITEYPFEDSYKVKVSASSPVNFDLTLRVPYGAKNALIDGKPVEAGYYEINDIWNKEKIINVSFSFDVRLDKRPNDMYCVKRGMLTFAVPIGERWEKKEYVRGGVERKFPYCDYEIFPTTEWNYAFANINFTVERFSVGAMPFSPEGAPLKIKAKFAPIDWKMTDGRCTEVPDSRTPIGESREIEMIPYGCTNLRMTEMPKVKGLK